MNAKEALKLLEAAPQSKTKMSKPFFPQTEFRAVEIIQECLEGLDPEDELNGVFVKRIWQVHKNQRRPRYEK